jgi:hypothetical protein
MKLADLILILQISRRVRIARVGVRMGCGTGVMRIIGGLERSILPSLAIHGSLGGGITGG